MENNVSTIGIARAINRISLPSEDSPDMTNTAIVCLFNLKSIDGFSLGFVTQFDVDFHRVTRLDTAVANTLFQVGISVLANTMER